MNRLVVIEPNTRLRKIYTEIFGEFLELVLLSSIAEITADAAPADFKNSIVLLEPFSDSYTSDDVENTLLNFNLEKNRIFVVSHERNDQIMMHWLTHFTNFYFTKPFDYQELVASVKAQTISAPMFTLDPLAFKAYRSGQETEQLTSNEYRLLSILLSSQRKVRCVDQICDTIWGRKNSKNNLHSLVSRLRDKVGKIGLSIKVLPNDTVQVSDDV